tara:strand:- start:365 stop:631 length:267 start_codon:yes stop_codon:yes gene_type:complete
MDKEMKAIIAIILDVCPDQINTHDMSSIIINLLIHKHMSHHWPMINANVSEVVVEHLVKSSLEAEEHQNNITAIKDADNFLEGIVNGV